MITDERISAYLRSLERPREPVAEAVRKEALQDKVPIIRPETEALLIFMVKYIKPKKILEVGTAVGYSSVIMSSCMPEGGHITTIENYPPRIEKAKDNFEKAGIKDKVTLLQGDATEILSKLTGEYDLIFMDAAKAQYIVWLPDILRLLSPTGLLFSDNVLQDGDVLESRFAVERRNRTIHQRMRDYLYTLKHSDTLSTSVIPIGDGVALTSKINGRESGEIYEKS